MNKEDIEDGVILEEEHYGVMPKTDSRYRVWVYNRIDGVMLSKIVDGPTAESLYSEGWKMTPAEFTEDEELKNVQQFVEAADDIAQVMNFLLNLELCEDRQALLEFAEGLLGMKVRKNITVPSLKKQMTEKATELGLIENDNSTPTD
jgi:hypothetical protein